MKEEEEKPFPTKHRAPIPSKVKQPTRAFNPSFVSLWFGLEKEEIEPSCSISIGVLDKATQCSSVVVKKWKTNREDKEDEKRKDFFSEKKPARRKAPKHEAIEEKVLF